MRKAVQSWDPRWLPKSNMATKMADNTYPWILEQNPPKTLADP